MSNHRYLIVNGDDFGLSSSVNQAIIQAHEQGILTSTSLMVTGDAFTEAVNLAKSHPKLGVGLHLVLGCGKSVLPHNQISHLVDGEGFFPENPVVAGLRYQFNRAAQQELVWEIRAQLTKFRDTGLTLSHVDGHLHHHVNPVVLRILVDLAPDFGIKYIRLPYEELTYTLNVDRTGLISKAIANFVFARLRQYGVSLLQSQGIGFTERVYGLLQTGNMSESYLLGLIPQIQSNLVEIYAHPGVTEDEDYALLSERVLKLVNNSGFKLTNYNALKL